MTPSGKWDFQPGLFIVGIQVFGCSAVLFGLPRVLSLGSSGKAEQVARVMKRLPFLRDLHHELVVLRSCMG